MLTTSLYFIVFGLLEILNAIRYQKGSQLFTYTQVSLVWEETNQDLYVELRRCANHPINVH